MSIPNHLMAQLVHKFGNTVTASELIGFSEECGTNVYRMARQGGLTLASRGVYMLTTHVGGQVTEEVVPTETREEISARIRERFDVMGIVADGVINANIRSLIVTGAAGVGKTYTLEQKLSAAENAHKINKFVSIKGSISAIGLYVTLFENSSKGNVLVLDDADSIFDDLEALNILKGALDTTEKRQISWIKDSSWLKDKEIPTTFEYEGQIVFISNKNFEQEIDRGSKMAPHLNALVSRSVFLDLGIHTNNQIMVRIEQVLSETDMAKTLGLTNSQSIMLLEWMKSNATTLRQVSLRTVIQLAAFVKTTSDWQRVASVTMLKSTGRRV